MTSNKDTVYITSKEAGHQNTRSIKTLKCLHGDASGIVKLR